MKRISFWIAPVLMMTLLMMTPTSAFATSKTYHLKGWFADAPSVAQGERELASAGAAKVCPSYGSWTDSFEPFTYTHTNYVFWQDYSASNVSFSVTCTFESVTHNFSGAWFADEASIQDGENAIENDLRKSVCGGGNHKVTNMHFNRYTYIRTDYVFWQDYSATGISGSFTCDE
jgi:hypothetical protein